MKDSTAIPFMLLGMVFILIGGSLSSSIWERFAALTWEKAEATITEVSFTGADSKVAYAHVTFVIADSDTNFSDSFFSRPWRRSTVATKQAQFEDKYYEGAKITVRHNGKKALLMGFPQSYANWNFVKILVGLLLLKSGITSFVKNRRLQ